MRTSVGWRLLARLPVAVRRAVYLRGMRFDPREVAPLSFRLAERRWEREQAFRLLHDMYVRRGILDPEQNKMRFSPWSVLPSTAVFVAVRETTVLGTMTLVEDSPIGLPMEETHAAEIAALRASGDPLAEVGSLAVTVDGRGKGLALMMYNLMFRWALRRRVRRLAIAVHPSAADFYQAVLLFSSCGPVRLYKTLKQAPSAPCALDLDAAVPAFRARYGKPARGRSSDPSRDLARFFLDEEMPSFGMPDDGAPPPWSQQDLAYFVEQLDARPRGLPLAHGQLLLGHYPFLSSVFNPDGSSRSSLRRAKEA